MEQRVSDERPEDVYDRMIREAEAAAYTRGFEEAREQAYAVAAGHECGGEDDIICQHQNCALCIAGGISKLRPASPEHEEMK